MNLNEEKWNKVEKNIFLSIGKLDEAIKQTEIFLDSMRNIQLQEQSRHNDSYHEIVERFKGHSKKETEFYGVQMKSLLDSLSSKIEEFSVADKNRENAIESLQNTLHQELNRFNQSFDLIIENFRLSSNRTIEELTERQQKDYEALMEKRNTVAFSAYTTKQQTITFYTNIKFEKVWTNIGNGYDLSIGILTAPREGIYHINAVVMSQNDKSVFVRLKHNNEYTSGRFVLGDGYKTGTIDVVFSLQKGDTISVGYRGSYSVYNESDKYTTFSGHLIA